MLKLSSPEWVEWFLADRQRRNSKEVRTAIAYCVLMILLAIFGRWPLLQAATASLALIRAFTAYYIHRHQKSLESIASEKPPQLRAEGLLKLDSSFLRSALYWYALPLGIGLLVIALAFWIYAHSLLLAALCVALAVGSVMGTQGMNSRGVSEMEEMRKKTFGA